MRGEPLNPLSPADLGPSPPMAPMPRMLLLGISLRMLRIQWPKRCLWSLLVHV